MLDVASSSDNACKIHLKNKPEGYILEGKIGYYAPSRECRVDYLNKHMKDSLEFDVDCSGKCDDARYDYEDEEGEEADTGYNTCVEDCHTMINEYSKGSFVFKETGELIEGNMPFDADPFQSKNEYDEFRIDDGFEKKVLRKFEKIGCRPDPDVGFRHPHEFAETTAGSEPEEDPAAFALHVRGNGPGKCMMDDVLNLVRKLEGEKPPGRGKYDYMFEGLNKFSD